jgi:hypothetical protein
VRLSGLMAAVLLVATGFTGALVYQDLSGLRPPAPVKGSQYLPSKRRMPLRRAAFIFLFSIL